MSSTFFLENVLIHLHSRDMYLTLPTTGRNEFLDNCSYPFLSLMGLSSNYPPRSVHSRRVSSIGGYDESSVFSRPMIVLLIGCLSGAVFGGIHCLGWNVLFRGYAEQILWRAASLAIVSAPASILLAGCVMRVSSCSKVIEASALYVSFISFFIYIIARVILIVLIFMSFRSLPSGIYDTVTWTNFIPHL
jgi:hypothetical protein